MDYRYNRHLTRAFSLLLLGSLAASAAVAQVTLNNLPTWTGNTRFATSAVGEVRHPSLSLNGFNCGSACSKGYGLKQILEQVPGLSTGTPLRDVYNRLVTLHDDAIVNSPTTRAQVNQNVAIMQARAFVALATYVLEKNSQSIVGLPTHSTAASLLKTALTTSAAWEPKQTYPDEGDDGVKWAGALSGLARTIDLYLALENAYCYYGGQGDATALAECNGTTSNRLLSQTQTRPQGRPYHDTRRGRSLLPPVREVIYREYRIMYHVDAGDEEVLILSALHSSRQFG